MRSLYVQKRAAYGRKDQIQVVAHKGAHRVTALVLDPFIIQSDLEWRMARDPRRGQNRSRVVPFFKKLLLQTGWLQHNQMDNNDLEACEKKCCYFWFHSEVKFLTRF